MHDREMSFWTSPPNCLLVLENPKNHQILGLISMQKITEKTVEFNRLAVRSDIRGLGIGRKLIDGLMVEARRSGFERVQLETTNTQKVAMKLYEKIGFVKIGEGGIEHVIGPYIPPPLHGIRLVKYQFQIQK